MTRLTLMHDTAKNSLLISSAILNAIRAFDKGNTQEAKRLLNVAEKRRKDLNAVLDKWYLEDNKEDEKIIVEVLGGVAYCDDSRVKIIDND